MFVQENQASYESTKQQEIPNDMKVVLNVRVLKIVEPKEPYVWHSNAIGIVLGGPTS